ncbi:serine hydrolase [Paenibacillus sp. LHD-117]|uniref:serine hydrolase domain-containing protein n=1 Tax=Paenibacillus sp. LHD-117 TaxID=3071412 RepID=UPI0027DFC0BE|nr:serine hydrolase [Paenibacillus sp. LHD-117]MDQ6421619.1 serine hydrolase [Paenibacillus sp. LHD-117]
MSLQGITDQLRDRRISSVIVHQGSSVAVEWHDRGEDAVMPLYSCTKSVLSALIGIAIARGELPGTDEPLRTFFDKAIVGGKEGWQDVTVKQLLTMTPGFDWPDFDKPYKALRRANDPVAFALEQPMAHTPGSAFTYNSGGSHLLSAILTEVSGMSALRYAKRHLFEPLGFRAAKWTERNGVSEGGTGLSLLGHDLVKFGTLYLNQGLWNGEQLLPKAWVVESTAMRHRALLLYDPPIYGGYGYHWWCSPAEQNGLSDCYFAFGHGGQYLMIIPALEAVIMVRKQITKRNDAIQSRDLIFNWIVPMILQK